jgi:phosphoglycerol transferase
MRATRGDRPARRLSAPASSRFREVFRTVAVGALALLAAAWVIRLWRADFATPFRYAQLDDTKFYLSLIRSIIRHGWFGGGSSLGAPFGQQLADFPQGADNLNFLIIRGLAVFSSDPGTIANVFYLLTFPLAASSAFAVLRKLGVASWSATVASVLFALLPYHFFRNESQLTLSAYYSVPLSAYLFLCVFIGEPRFRKRAVGGPPILRWLSWRTARTLTACVVIASSGLYYAAFGLVLLCAAAVVAPITGRGRQAVASAVGCALVVSLVLGANLAPSLIYRAQHGSNPAIARSLTDTELLGLKPAQLLLPVQGHRLPLLHNINVEYGQASAASYCEQCYQTLGTVGDIGFLWLLAGALAAVMGVGGLLARSRLYGPASLGVLLSLVIASVGGVSSLLAYFVSPDVRGWNRMSLFIAFFSLLAAALLIEAGMARLRRLRGSVPWTLVATIALVVLGVLDETSPDFVPAYAASRAEYKTDVAFFASVERRLGAGAAVFELPYVPFPEGYGATTSALGFGGVNFGTTYEESRGYITSNSLRWSWGGIKGRPTDWESELAAKPLSVSLAAAALNGFAGLVVEPSGYKIPPAVLRSALESEVGEPPLVSRYGSLWFFDLRAYAARLARALGSVAAQEVREATLAPARVTCSSAGLTITGGSRTRPALVTLTASIAGLEQILGGLVMRFPDGTSQTVPFTETDAAIDHQLVLTGGKEMVRFATMTQAPRSYTLQVENATATAATLNPLGRRPAAQITTGYPPPLCLIRPRLASARQHRAPPPGARGS